MNIIQIQDDLKGLPDQELIKEVQAPSGIAPVYLLLGELQRREKIKAEFGGADEITRQVFAALKDTRGYGSKVAGGAQWSIGHGVYTQDQYY